MLNPQTLFTKVILTIILALRCCRCLPSRQEHSVTVETQNNKTLLPEMDQTTKRPVGQN